MWSERPPPGSECGSVQLYPNCAVLSVCSQGELSESVDAREIVILLRGTQTQGRCSDAEDAFIGDRGSLASMAMGLVFLRPLHEGRWVRYQRGGTSAVLSRWPSGMLSALSLLSATVRCGGIVGVRSSDDVDQERLT